MSLGAAKLLLDASLKKAVAKVDRSDRQDVSRALGIFAEDPLDPRLRFEKYVGVKNVYTIRANYNLRIFMTDIGSMVMRVIHIGNHDFIRRR